MKRKRNSKKKQKTPVFDEELEWGKLSEFIQKAFGQLPEESEYENDESVNEEQ